MMIVGVLLSSSVDAAVVQELSNYWPTSTGTTIHIANGGLAPLQWTDCRHSIRVLSVLISPFERDRVAEQFWGLPQPAVDFLPLSEKPTA